MKIQTLIFCILTFLNVLIFSNVYGQDNWQLYDDFSTGTISSEKWLIDDSSATITVDNGHAVFKHKSGYPEDSSWLSFADSPETVIGVKATFTVQSCSGDSGDVRVRINAFLGKVGNEYIRSTQQIRPYDKQLKAGTSSNSGPPNYEWLYDYFWGNFQQVDEAIGVPFTISTILSGTAFRYSTDNIGELEYMFPAETTINKLSKEESWIGIGTQSITGEGECTIFVDEVYVLRDSSSTWYWDNDGDRYGDQEISVESASQPTGYVAEYGDCDDNDENINPGTTETCNDVDDNCDGIIDETCSTLQGFDVAYYLQAKLAALKAVNPEWLNATVSDLQATLNGLGFTAETHYNLWGYKEGLSPNRFFNQSEYIHAKALALYNGGGYSSVVEAEEAFNAAWPYDAYQHYLLYGAAEGINPSNAFDEKAYLTDKLAALQAAGDQWDNKTIDDLRAFLSSINLTSLNHYLKYGIAEDLTPTPVK
ncbi:Putative metal-binding motif-containing protein [Desulfopila aestuarii DSM 18488]|uniref:Putative metal-binding motif-containing protein n=2 Tax=Desulfopila aestuarii TaxID=231440 RepID=A0A1M7YME6_9BACT|nr:Putative metal-binding motif-containing protein [Desulfopila aestuarii DSM 18488]